MMRARFLAFSHFSLLVWFPRESKFGLANLRGR
jgi:hypothetical protein